jgi:hypothetical protein
MTREDKDEEEEKVSRRKAMVKTELWRKPACLPSCMMNVAFQEKQRERKKDRRTYCIEMDFIT